MIQIPSLRKTNTNKVYAIVAGDKEEQGKAPNGQDKKMSEVVTADVDLVAQALGQLLDLKDPAAKDTIVGKLYTA